jgi:hypothetical protein
MADLYADSRDVHAHTRITIMLMHHDSTVRMLHAFGYAGSSIANLAADALSMRRVTQTKPQSRGRGPDQNLVHHRLRKRYAA